MTLDSSISLDLLVAHRGLQADYPENTILGFNKAIEQGAKFIELDIQFSKEKVYVKKSLQFGKGKVSM